MAWSITEHESPTTQQEIRVKLLLMEMAEYSYATYAEQFESHFKGLVKDLPRTNNYSADMMFKIKAIGYKRVQVWKLTTAGDFKHKMWTLDLID